MKKILFFIFIIFITLLFSETYQREQVARYTKRYTRLTKYYANQSLKFFNPKFNLQARETGVNASLGAFVFRLPMRKRIGY